MDITQPERSCNANFRTTFVQQQTPPEAALAALYLSQNADYGTRSRTLVNRIKMLENIDLINGDL